jgi:hypothetical protein
VCLPVFGDENAPPASLVSINEWSESGGFEVKEK